MHIANLFLKLTERRSFLPINYFKNAQRARKKNRLSQLGTVRKWRRAQRPDHFANHRWHPIFRVTKMYFSILLIFYKFFRNSFQLLRCGRSFFKMSLSEDLRCSSHQELISYKNCFFANQLVTIPGRVNIWTTRTLARKTVSSLQY